MTMLDEFIQGVEKSEWYNPFWEPERNQQLIAKIKEDAHESWVQMYSHNTAITPIQARELAAIYVKLYFAEQEYLKLNKEFSKYTAK